MYMLHVFALRLVDVSIWGISWLEKEASIGGNERFEEAGEERQRSLWCCMSWILQVDRCYSRRRRKNCLPIRGDGSRIVLYDYDALWCAIHSGPLRWFEQNHTVWSWHAIHTGLIRNTWRRKHSKHVRRRRPGRSSGRPKVLSSSPFLSLFLFLCMYMWTCVPAWCVRMRVSLRSMWGFCLSVILRTKRNRIIVFSDEGLSHAPFSFGFAAYPWVQFVRLFTAERKGSQKARRNFGRSCSGLHSRLKRM